MVLYWKPMRRARKLDWVLVRGRSPLTASGRFFAVSKYDDGRWHDPSGNDLLGPPGAFITLAELRAS